jgi:hypothetical protein
MRAHPMIASVGMAKLAASCSLLQCSKRMPAIGGQADIWRHVEQPDSRTPGRSASIGKEIPTPMFVPRFELMLEARGRKRTNKQTRRRKPS